MTTIWSSCRAWADSSQRHLNTWIPSLPQDTLWGGVKSMTGSFVIGTAWSQGNIIAGAESAMLAGVAVMVHAVVVVLLNAVKQEMPEEELKQKKEELKRVPHLAALTGFISAYLIGHQLGFSMHVVSVVATVVPYILSRSSESLKVGTPFFGVVVLCCRRV